MKLYRTSIGRRVSGQNVFDYYSGQLSHLSDWVDIKAAKAHLKDGAPVGSSEWPEVYDEKGNFMKLEGNKLVKI